MRKGILLAAIAAALIAAGGYLVSTGDACAQGFCVGQSCVTSWSCGPGCACIGGRCS